MSVVSLFAMEWFKWVPCPPVFHWKKKDVNDITKEIIARNIGRQNKSPSNHYFKLQVS
jgi:hypothetical protein